MSMESIYGTVRALVCGVSSSLPIASGPSDGFGIAIAMEDIWGWLSFPEG